VWPCELPEDGELLDGFTLHLASLLVLQVFNYHVREDSRHQFVEFPELIGDIFSVNLVIKQRPEVLDDLLAVGEAVFLEAVFLVGILQKVQEFLLENLDIFENFLGEFSRLSLRVGCESLDVSDGASSGLVRLIFNSQQLNENIC
jgi:hypothetical protein